MRHFGPGLGVVPPASAERVLGLPTGPAGAATSSHPALPAVGDRLRNGQARVGRDSRQHQIALVGRQVREQFLVLRRGAGRWILGHGGSITRRGLAATRITPSHSGEMTSPNVTSSSASV